jgi:hypothetical protein
VADLEQEAEGSQTEPSSRPRPVALVTGVGRTIGIGAGIARRLAASGWDIAFTFWTPYDQRMSWGIEAGAADTIGNELTARGAAVAAIETDLADTAAPAAIYDEAERRLGPITADQRSHCGQSSLRRQQGCIGPYYPGRGSRVGTPRHQLERHQPRPGRHRLDDRHDSRQRHPAHTTWPPRHCPRHREPGRFPVLATRPVDQRPTAFSNGGFG